MRVRCFVVLAAIAISASAARADIDNSLFVAAGPLLGGSIHEGPNGLLIGGELSAGWLRTNPPNDETKPFWLGVYADALYDWGSDTGRVSIGPELGYFIFGFDGGVVRETGGAGRWGFSGRVSFSIPVTWNEREKHPRLATVTTVSLSFRRVTWRGESAGHGEIGLLLKWALPAVAGG